MARVTTHRLPIPVPWTDYDITHVQRKSYWLKENCQILKDKMLEASAADSHTFDTRPSTIRLNECAGQADGIDRWLGPGREQFRTVCIMSSASACHHETTEACERFASIALIVN